eukprot:TRINITY_DN7742_c0_g1_i1.p1 TRINITY_DN7742_c0_g1~~TRINITY_DN7742_c0_g1_i1.p1  ORF type:complete len:231 (-),score=43.48 TRINITY_DN7742_c0_g1_i1:26-718(-)
MSTLNPFEFLSRSGVFDDLLGLILRFLDIPSLLLCAQVSLPWHRVVSQDDESRWKPLVPTPPHTKLFSIHKLNYLQVLEESSPSFKRIQKELRDLCTDSYSTVSFGPHADARRRWLGTIYSDGSPYASAPLQLDIRLPREYPFQPPKVVFLSKVYHPNVSRRGEICLAILKDHWSPALTVEKVLLAIDSLLRCPNLEEPLDKDAAYHYEHDRGTFNRIAKEWCELFIEGL